MLDCLKKWAPFISAIVSTICILISGALVTTIFVYSRFDHDLKLIALTSVVSIASQMMATASTLLVGKSFGTDQSTLIPNPLPDRSKLTQSTTLTTESESDKK